MIPRTARILQLVFAVFLLSVFVGCKEEKPQSFERPPAPVIVAVAEQKDVPIYIDAVGNTVAREEVMVKPQVDGRIEKIHFTDGANVTRGTLLFTIDPRPFQAALNEAEANLAQAKAALDLAKIEFDRVANLVDTRAMSKSDIDTRKNRVDVTEAQVQQRQAMVDTARLNLEYCTVRSPINGRAGQRLVDPGNVVIANETQLLSVQRLDPIYADFTVTENELSDVQKNVKQGSLKVEVRLPDDNEKVRTGELTFMDNAVLEGTGTVRLRATVPNGDWHFWPKRFVKVRLILSTQKNAVLVSAAAPQQSAKGPFVYVIKPDSTAELRPVTVGQQQGDLIVVSKGVKPGEKIVVNGQLGVTPGGKVRIEQSRAESQQAQNGGKS